MYDLIRASITFDMNYVFRFYNAKDCDSYIRKCIDTPDKNYWSSSWAGIKDSVESDFKTMVDIYNERAK